MLKRWSLANFKPIHDRVDIELGAVTVLSGLNSSGKSSVLQSILLVAQTLSSQVQDWRLVLNGHMIQLGTFANTLNDSAGSAPMLIGYELETAGRRHATNLSPPSGAFAEGYASGGRTDRTVTVNSRFTKAVRRDESGISAMKVTLLDSTIDIRPIDGMDMSTYYSQEQLVSWNPLTGVNFRVRPMRSNRHQHFLKGVREEYLRLAPSNEGGPFETTLPSGAEPKRRGTTLLVRMSHFLPTQLIGRFDLGRRHREEIEALIDRYLSTGSSTGAGAGRSGLLLPLKERERLLATPVDRALNELVTEATAQSAVTTGVPKLAMPTLEDRPIGDLLNWVRRTAAGRKVSKSFTSAVRAAVLQALERPTDAPTGFGLESVRGRADVEQLDMCVSDVSQFFTRMIRYVGPLRADPQPAHRYSPTNLPDDVGTKGEYAAAVYDANKRVRLQWIHPEARAQVSGTLEEAVNAWAGYLGIAAGVSSQEAGLAGVSWMIESRAGSKRRPLPSVGVGVSQVLPILVAGLLAPQGTLLLFEQPELHLHARAQARLADFFASLAQIGKQCIVETHSDALVHRFRYLMVEGGGAVRESIRMYFVSQDEQGAALFEPIIISPLGRIVNWPEGFFDESLVIEDQIAAASMRARVNEDRA